MIPAGSGLFGNTPIDGVAVGGGLALVGRSARVGVRVGTGVGDTAGTVGMARVNVGDGLAVAVGAGERVGVCEAVTMRRGTPFTNMVAVACSALGETLVSVPHAGPI